MAVLFTPADRVQRIASHTCRVQGHKNVMRISKVQSEENFFSSNGKVAPQAVDAEQAVLSVMLSFPAYVGEVRNLLRAEYFYKESHQLIFKAIGKLHEKGKVIDLIQVTHQLKSDNNLDAVGGPFYITQLSGIATSPVNVMNWALIINEKYLQRQMIIIGGKMQKEAFDDSDPIEQINKVKDLVRVLDSTEIVRSTRINCNMEPGKNVEILQLGGRRILSIGNIGAMIAPPGYGKSQVCEAICASYINPTCDALGFNVIGTPIDGGVLYVDTERSLDLCISAIHRIKMRVDVKKNPGLLLSNGELRGLAYESMISIPTISQRKHLLEGLITKGGSNGQPYRLVIIDGITDLIEDVNDSKESPAVIAWLIALCNRYGTGIFTTIHDNPAMNKNKARGVAGSELGRKVESMMLLTRSIEDKNIRSVTMDFEYGKNRAAADTGLTTYFSWDPESHMMQTVDFKPTMKASEIKGLKELLTRVFDGVTKMAAHEVRKRYSALAAVQSRTTYTHLKQAVQSGILEYDENTLIYELNEVPF